MGKIEDTIYNAFLLAVCAAAIYLIAMMAGGCQMDPATRAALQQMESQHQKDLKDLRDKFDLKNTEANLDPTKHPILAGNQTVVGSRKPLSALAGIGTLAFLIGVGLWFVSSSSPFSKLASALAGLLVPLGASVGGGAWLLLLFLPFWPWIVGSSLAVILGTVGWHLYQLHKKHLQNSAKITTVAAKTGTVIEPITFGKAVPAA